MPQPVDFGTEANRTMAAERIQQVAERGALAGQQRAAEKAGDDLTQLENSVAETPETQNEQIDEELKRKNPYARRKRKGQDKHDQDKERHPPSILGEGESLDVRV